MGRRVIIKLEEFIDHADIDVYLSMVSIGDEDNTFVRIAEVNFKQPASENHGPKVFTFDVDVFKGEISLSADFNLWGSTFESLTYHMHNKGICYRVV